MSGSKTLAGGLKPGLPGLMVGAYSVFWGLKRIVRDPDLRRLAVLPLLITIVLYAGMATSVLLFADDALSELWPYPEEAWMVVFWWVALVVSVVASVGLMVLLFATIAEAVGGPFYDKMAVKILGEHHIETKEPGFIEGTVPDLIRSLLFLIPAFVCWLLGLIPLVGIPFVVLGAIIAWLGFASTAVNPALLVTGNGLGARIRYVFRFFLSMLGIGGVVSLSMLVPLLGLVAIPASIVGASELYANSRSA